MKIDHSVRKEILNVAETSRIFGYSDKTVRNKISNGTFPIKSVKIGGKRGFKAEDVYRFLDQLK